MLSKVLKYEFRDATRTLLPLGGGALVLAALTGLIGLLRRNASALLENQIVGVITFTVELITMLGLMAVMFICIFFCVNRFYRMLGEQGYLEMALPVTPNQHIAGKVICGMVCTLGAIVVMVLCGLLISWPDLSLSDLIFWQGLPIQAVPILLSMFVTLLAGLFAFYLNFYFCVAVGAQFPQHRMGASVVCFFVMQFVGQILSVALLSFLGWVGNLLNLEPAIEQFFLHIREMDDMTAMVGMCCALFLMIALIFIAVGAILWAVTQYLIGKKLNLA